MGLTRRKNSFYVEFRVVDDGKTFTLAREIPGARLKRWKVSSLNKTVAKQQEALIKTDLMKGLVKSDQVQGPMTFKTLTEGYLALPRVMAQANNERKQRWVEQCFLPTFGTNRLISAITPESIEAYYQSRRKEVPWPRRIGNSPRSNISSPRHVGQRGS